MTMPLGPQWLCLLRITAIQTLNIALICITQAKITDAGAKEQSMLPESEFSARHGGSTCRSGRFPKSLEVWVRGL